MYYLFRGLQGVSGEAVVGRLVATNEEAVHKALDAHGVIAESISPDAEGRLFPQSLQAALDEIGVRITFNQMPKTHVGGGIWILDRTQFPRRVMGLAREACKDTKDREEALSRIEHLLESLYGDRPPATSSAMPAEGRFASAEEVRAEMARLQAAIKNLERELRSMRFRPAPERETRHAARQASSQDRTRDEVLREIFEHNLKLMKLSKEYGINGPTA